MSKKDSYLAIFAISILTAAIAVLVYYLLRVHVPPQPVQAEEAEDPKKAARRAQREAARRQREEMLREQEEKRAALEEKQAKREEERLRREHAELEKKLYEYNKWKSQMKVIDEKDVYAKTGSVSDDAIAEFIKSKKCVTVDQVSLRFGLSIPEAMNRLTMFNTEGVVVDDRGMAIYITDQELELIGSSGVISLPTMKEKIHAANSIISLIPSDASAQASDEHADNLALDLFIS